MLTLLAVTILTIQGVAGLSYAGCFTSPTPNGRTDVVRLGWTGAWNVPKNTFTIQFCIAHCVQNNYEYAGLDMLAGGKTEVACHCGSKKAFTSLGVALHTEQNQACAHASWAFTTYKAVADAASQYIGCYTEVQSAPASSTHEWIDTWMITVDTCITYCNANGAAFANLKYGDSCSCSHTFAKHGKTADSNCNKPCPGDRTEFCGGDKALSVYSTIGLADVLNPGSTVVTHDFGIPSSVSVPQTEKLIQSFLNLDKATNGGSKLKSQAEFITNFQKSVIPIITAVIGLQSSVDGLASSIAFKTLKDKPVVDWLSKGQLPAELISYQDVIRQAKEFVDKDIPALKAQLSTFSSLMSPLMGSIATSSKNLNEYFDHGRLSNSIQLSLKIALNMVSASKHCIPRLTGGHRKSVVDTFEGVSNALINGQWGVSTYLANIKKIEGQMNKLKAARKPSPTISTWKSDLDFIKTTWTSFFEQKAGALFFMTTMKTYDVYEGCAANAIGKRAVVGITTPAVPVPTQCVPVKKTVTFNQLVTKPGNNEAKTDMANFIKENRSHFTAFNWSALRAKLNGIGTQITDIQSFLQSSGSGSVKDIKQMEDELTSFRFYQTCITQIGNLIEKLCHKTENPDTNQIQSITC